MKRRYGVAFYTSVAAFLTLTTRRDLAWVKLFEINGQMSRQQIQ
jgi:hypothetical protein